MNRETSGDYICCGCDEPIDDCTCPENDQEGEDEQC